MEIKATDIEILKAEVEYTIGRKIMTSKDCIDLSEAILAKTEFRINSNTLRRFFGLVKSQYPASLSTLNILSVYTGAASFEDLRNYRKHSNEIIGKDAPKLLKFLTILFQNIKVSDENDATFLKVAHTTIDFLNQDSDIAYQFQRAIAKTENGKRFYFEQFINIDKLNSFYGKGLRYYISENKSKNAQIFGHSLLCLRYWLIQDNDNLRGHYKSLLIYELSEDVNLLTCARYFAAKLMFAESNNLDIIRILNRANEFYASVKPIKKFHNSFPGFELILLEALVLTGHYNAAFKFISDGVLKELENGDIAKTFMLYNAIVLFNLGSEKRAGELFDQINPFEFYFINKQFYTIQYLLIGQKLNKIRSVKNQIDFLVQETGFKRLVVFNSVIQ